LKKFLHLNHQNFYILNYYIETGDIWNGGDLVIDQENDLYLSIASEMQNVEDWFAAYFKDKTSSES